MAQGDYESESISIRHCQVHLPLVVDCMCPSRRSHLPDFAAIPEPDLTLGETGLNRINARVQKLYDKD
jgi:hypothetical protein